MKRLMVGLLLVSVCAASLTAAPMFRVYRTEGGGTDTGPFQTQIVDEGDVVRSYITLCVDNGLQIEPGRLYDFSIDDAVQYRSNGALASDPLREQTQKVYAAYVNAGTPLRNDWSAPWDQAVWDAQAGLQGTDPAGAGYSAALAGVMAGWDPSGYHLVRVVNPWLPGQITTLGTIQPSLTIIPAPSALLLTTIGAGLVRRLRRR